MEKSLGIEAARARLGDIADHARTTGQVTALTRHGRTVAVIGPAHAVQPAGRIKVTLYLGDDDQVCVLPALPRIRESLLPPAHAVQAAGSIKVALCLDDDDQVCVLPALPRVGESFLVETADGNEEYWLVTNIQWDLRPDEEPSVNVLCDPSDDYSAWIAANRPSANEK